MEDPLKRTNEEYTKLFYDSLCNALYAYWHLHLFQFDNKLFSSNIAWIARALGLNTAGKSEGDIPQMLIDGKKILKEDFNDYVYYSSTSNQSEWSFETVIPPITGYGFPTVYDLILQMDPEDQKSIALQEVRYHGDRKKELNKDLPIFLFKF
ncbi:MAG: hypothetical protein IPL46_29130 [Saprospiraceae bacterium]|nr:hypothetical protein [Saprospiraceae bacterium]